MSGTDAYDALIMDHIKNARNYFVPDEVTGTATGSNPLCGDDITVYLRIADARVAVIAFQCTCCGISMASASIMTEMIKGKDMVAARRLLGKFIAMLNDQTTSLFPEAVPGQRAILQTVQKYRSRVRCAALPWATLEGALDNRQDTVFVR